jgi:hypothetical protein
MKALRYFETSVNIHQSSQPNIPDDLKIHPFSREDDTRNTQMNSCQVGQKKKKLRIIIIDSTALGGPWPPFEVS